MNGKDCNDVTVACACGCTRNVNVPEYFFEHLPVARVKIEHRPSGYCGDHGSFVVSGDTGYVYASLHCLNSINECF